MDIVLIVQITKELKITTKDVLITNVLILIKWLLKMVRVLLVLREKGSVSLRLVHSSNSHQASVVGKANQIPVSQQELHVNRDKRNSLMVIVKTAPDLQELKTIILDAQQTHVPDRIKLLLLKVPARHVQRLGNVWSNMVVTFKLQQWLHYHHHAVIDRHLLMVNVKIVQIFQDIKFQQVESIRVTLMIVLVIIKSFLKTVNVKHVRLKETA